MNSHLTLFPVCGFIALNVVSCSYLNCKLRHLQGFFFVCIGNQMTPEQSGITLSLPKSTFVDIWSSGHCTTCDVINFHVSQLFR